MTTVSLMTKTSPKPRPHPGCPCGPAVWQGSSPTFRWLIITQIRKLPVTRIRESQSRKISTQKCIRIHASVKLGRKGLDQHAGNINYPPRSETSTFWRLASCSAWDPRIKNWTLFLLLLFEGLWGSWVIPSLSVCASLGLLCVPFLKIKMYVYIDISVYRSSNTWSCWSRITLSLLFNLNSSTWPDTVHASQPLTAGMGSSSTLRSKCG